ncbi:MAG: type II toxin-antitoxin system VapC family toxin [Chitinispirillaceae bacterium]|nr:type II toxin-antitoxin system VapC family toxin [Chitinispirillaceae bacterium]
MSRNQQGVVIDCSFIMSVLLPDEQSERSQEVLESGRYAPAVPALWTIEVCNVLLTAVRRKRLTTETRGLLLTNLQKLDIRVHGHEPAMERIMQLAVEYDLTAYDAVYLDLSLYTGYPIATHDKELKNAAMKAGLAIL